jgi:hypothetical protein
MLRSRIQNVALCVCFAWLLADRLTGILIVRPTEAADAKATKLDQLLEEKVRLLEQVAVHVDALFNAARMGFEDVYLAQMELERARMELCKTDDDRLAVYERMLEQSKKREAAATKSTTIGMHERIKSQVDRLDIQIAMERVRSK